MELNELRTELDAIDAELLTLFGRRMEIAAAVAEYKKDRGLPVLDAAREEQILQRAETAAGKEGRALYGLLLRLSREKQEEILEQK